MSYAQKKKSIKEVDPLIVLTIVFKKKNLNALLLSDIYQLQIEIYFYKSNKKVFWKFIFRYIRIINI